MYRGGYLTGLFYLDFKTPFEPSRLGQLCAERDPRRAYLALPPPLSNVATCSILSLNPKMPSFFSRLKGGNGPTKLKSKKNAHLNQFTDQLLAKPRWEDAFTRKTVEPEEIQELVSRCTGELKARGTTSNLASPARFHLICLPVCLVAHGADEPFPCSSRSPFPPFAFPAHV